MKVLGIGLLILVVVIGAAFVAQFRSMQALQTEIGALRAERVAAPREAKPEASSITPIAEMILRNDETEFSKLREELAALRTEVKQIAKSQSEMASVIADAVPLQLVAAQEWKNAGRETPAATMETIYWAALAGELEVLANALLIPEEDRAKVDAWYAGLSESTRRQYGTVEQLIGLLVAKEAGPLTGMQVLSQNELGADDVLLHVRFGLEDGGVDSAEYLLRRTSDGWRLVVPGDGVEWFSRHLRPDN